MIAQRQSRMPYLFFGAVPTVFVVIWSLKLAGVMEVESPGTVVISWLVYLLFLPLAVSMWVRFFRVPYAARMEDGDLVLWSMAVFPKQVRIPFPAVMDAWLVRKDVMGDKSSVLRLELADGEEIRRIRSAFKSAPYFGFEGKYFDCCPCLTEARSEALAVELRRLVWLRDGAGNGGAARTSLVEET